MSNKNIREFKGLSLLKYYDSFVVVDLETTGLSPYYDDIIEFGAIKVCNNEIVAKYETLVNPGYEIEEYITELTGITNEMLQNAPAINNVIDDFIKFVGNDIIVGHNVNFDINFIYDTLFKYRNNYFSNDFVDTMRLSRNLVKNINHHRLIDMIQYFNIAKNVAHRSLSDCYNTLSVYYMLKEKTQLEYGSIENYYDSLQKANNRNQYYKRNILKDLTSQVTLDSLDPEHPFYRKNFVFTGTPSRFETKEDVAQTVINLGAFVNDNVTKETNYLVVGDYKNVKTFAENKSRKIEKAERYILNGCDLTILPEEEFYEILDSYDYETQAITENEIFEKIKNSISKKYENIVEIKLKKAEGKTENLYYITAYAEPTPWRLDSSEKTIARIKFGKDVSYVGFSIENKLILEKSNVFFKTNKNENILRIGLNEFQNIPQSVLTQMLTNIMISSFRFEPFGCCGKFKECAESGICTHEDILYANACQYRKLISRE